MWVIVSPFLVSMLILGASGMAVPSDDLLAQGRQSLELGESGFDAATLRRAQAIFDGLARSEVPSALVAYYQARAALAQVNVHAWRKESDEALRQLDHAIASAKTAIQRNPHHSDSHRLLGEAYGRLIGFKGGMAGMLYGRRAHDEIALALKLDGENPRAWLALGIWKLRTPRLFGGNPEEAVRHFQKTLQLAPESIPGRVWLAIALKERGRRAEAREVLEQALAREPQNEWVRGELDRVGSSR